MNDCIRYQEKLHDWVDQELDLPTSEEIQLHLSQCPQCADAAKGIQHMKELVRSKAWKPEAPVSLQQGDRKSTRLNSQSRSDLVCRLLLEKKNKHKKNKKKNNKNKKKKDNK